MNYYGVLLLVGVLGWTHAIESEPVQVLMAFGGDSIAVKTEVGGQAFHVPVRLLYVDTPATKLEFRYEPLPGGQKSEDFLRSLIRESGGKVTLWAPGGIFMADRYGNLLAVVIGQDGIPWQEKIIAAGWSAAWERYGGIPERWREQWIAAQLNAQFNELGAWPLCPDFMFAKARETEDREQRTKWWE